MLQWRAHWLTCACVQVLIQQEMPLVVVLARMQVGSVVALTAPHQPQLAAGELTAFVWFASVAWEPWAPSCYA